MNATILVVAPDSAFRLSLRFMLESEGYRVEVLSGMRDVHLFRHRVDCVIVDDEILQRHRMPIAALLDEGGPVVVLADNGVGGPVSDRLRIVEKPLLGDAVNRAVRTLLDAAGSARSR